MSEEQNQADYYAWLNRQKAVSAEGPKFNVLHQEYFGGPFLRKGSGLTEQRADEYIKEMQSCHTGAWTKEPNTDPAK